jgi:hypothetical protein
VAVIALPSLPAFGAANEAWDLASGLRCYSRTIGVVKPILCIGVHGLGEVVYLSFGFFPDNSVTFLEQADELLTPAGGALQIVIGQIAPFFPHFAFHLFPFSGYLIGVHGDASRLVLASQFVCARSRYSIPEEAMRAPVRAKIAN